MRLEERIETFAELGKILRDALAGNAGRFENQLNLLITNQEIHNPWFTPENVHRAIAAIANELTKENLIKWTDSYPLLKERTEPVKAGVIMAGNIPLVGFHDFLSVLISGNILKAKTSSKDSELIELLSDILCSINEGFREKIDLTTNTLINFDVVIATGSNNSSRYFEYYFSKYPNIIRKNRNSIAIIGGDETGQELQNLGTDIFSYFGLGCRNISKIYLPAGYDVTSLTSHWESFSDIIYHKKYANNYDFNKAVYIVNRDKFHDTGYLLMREENKLSSPVSVLFYEYYQSEAAVKQQTEIHKESIQCIAGKHYLPFGQAQSPKLWDYADGIDTIEFLLKKNIAGIL